MTNAIDAYGGKPFRRGIRNQNFIDALKELAKQKSWWSEVLADPALIIAIRDEYLNVYWQGQSLFKVSYVNDAVQAKTHPKYLLDPALENLVSFDGHRFALPSADTLLVHTWTAADALGQAEKKTTLAKMKKAAALYAGGEKEGVHHIVRRHSAVLDVEISLRLPYAQQDQRMLPRIDIASLEGTKDKVCLVFWEAKLFSNHASLRAAGDANPPVLEQIKDYQLALNQQRDNVLTSYRQVAKNLLQIAEMRPHRFTALDELTKKVAEGPELLTVADPPDVGLLIFEFDGDQKDGRIWKSHRTKLETAIPDRLIARGNAKHVRLGCQVTKRLKSQADDLRENLEGLARFALVFAASNFQFGIWHYPPPDPSGILEFPYCSLSDEASKFVETAYKLGWVKQFQWSEWKDTPEGRGLMENLDRVADATPDQLTKLLTVYIRGDRFNEGLLCSAFESGLLTAIVKRAEALLRMPPYRGGSPTTEQ